MTRTKLCDRLLPDYTRGEEIFNMVTHIVGGALGIIVLVTCVLKAALFSDAWAVVSSAVYGSTMIVLYSVSSIYHGLRCNFGKKVMQVIDHCTIFFLIAGTYTPIVLCSIRRVSAGWGWALFGIQWGLTALGATLNAIDRAGLFWLLAGGIAYTLGAVLYGVGTKVRYMHSIFHIFVVLGSLLQYICILFYVI